MVGVLLSGCTAPRLPDDPALAALRADGRVLELEQRWRLPAGSDDAAWAQVPPQRVILHPQNAIAPGLDGGDAITAELRAVSDGEGLALRLAWPDAGEDRYSTTHTDRFADAVAVQFAIDGAPPLPYVGMGEPQRPVRLWFWRAGRGAENLAAHGFGTLAANGDTPPAVEARRTADGWVVTLRGPLPATANPLPLSVAVWDGAGAGRDGRKRLSAWQLLLDPRRTADRARLTALAQESRSHGAAQNGARLVREHGCIACHRLPGQAAADIGPDLTRAGALHWPGYLRRSIAEPSAFVLPRATYHAPGSGQTSLMPKLNLPPAAVEAITAYLATLRGGEE
ncbi:MAG: ethylbenzene dehydrogenase-related protein [Pseudomonadota bacterium]